MFSLIRGGLVPIVKPGSGLAYTIEAIEADEHAPHEQPTQTHRATFTIPEAAEAIGIGITTTKALIKSGELPSFVVRRRRLVRREALETYLRRREAGKSKR